VRRRRRCGRDGEGGAGALLLACTCPIVPLRDVLRARHLAHDRQLAAANGGVFGGNTSICTLPHESCQIPPSGKNLRRGRARRNGTRRHRGRGPAVEASTKNSTLQNVTTRTQWREKGKRKGKTARKLDSDPPPMARQAATGDRGERPRGTEREQRTRHTDETTPYTTPAARRERGTGEVIAKFTPKSRPPGKFKTTREDRCPATARDWHPDDNGKARHRQHC